MSAIEIDYVGEGRCDDVIAMRMILSVQGVPGISYRRPLSGTGKNSLDKRLGGLNKGTLFRNPVLALRDLDQDAACAPALLASLLPDKNPKMLLRICVHESESWLMADREAYAEFCGTSPGNIPDRPETIRDPKGLIQTLGESGKAPRLTQHFNKLKRTAVPMWAVLGEWHAEFAENHWDPARTAATNRAPSLSRALSRLKEIVTTCT
jgi:hypothetical protein